MEENFILNGIFKKTYGIVVSMNEEKRWELTR